MNLPGCLDRRAEFAGRWIQIGLNEAEHVIDRAANRTRTG